MKTSLAAASAVALLSAGLLVVAPSANAAAPTAKVAVTTQRMAKPTLNSTQLGWYNAGQTLTLSCYSRGQAVTGYYSPWLPNGGFDDYWYKTSDGGFVADVDINTNSNSPITPACNDPFTTAPNPSVTGTAAIGQVLRANPGTWDPAATFSYQWLLAGAPVTGATAATWTPPATALGKAVSVRVTGTRPGFAATTRTSAATAALGKGTLVPGVPSIAGTPIPGQTLTASPGAWSPAASYTYQWRRNGAPITGATAAGYLVAAADLNTDLTVLVTGTATAYNPASAVSAAVRVGKQFTAAPTPAISGGLDVGARLTATVGAWAPAPQLAFQWLRNGAPIAGATGTAYVLTTADAGTSITFRVTGSLAGYATAVRTSTGLTTRALLSPSPVPVIRGYIAAGQTVTAIAGTWGPGAVTLSYQWLRNGVPIAGATGPTLALSSAHTGAQLSVRVGGTAAGFIPVTRTSAATVVAANTVGMHPYKLPFPFGKSYTILQGPAEHARGPLPEYNKTAVDFGTGYGAPIDAAASGLAVFAGVGYGGNLQVRIDHGDNRCTDYSHLSSTTVTAGTPIAQGQLLGYSGQSGMASGPHLHWNVVYCDSQLSRAVPDSLEMGTTYRVGAVATSRNG
ncbi:MULTISPECIES: peptidoglycan DD-metalloendopeptidase family protein [Arthrobacter]|uniref:Peptidoglycan DD-metalloendopeptidase family protein n=2 Tax=Arthrobacter TaxID=1663 RepID=A0ABU9KJG7_9MICC|nr:peptidoglycan DD-metalloendopeptidase family protein [Arthrobacter sp. YJM1]MDP5226713.1 peptidoglycan DD-metalloendopeptidase family protein [Arthrobacter sp. YJM1]